MAAEINIHNRAPLAPVCGPYGVFCRKKRLICLASKISAQGNHKTALDSAQTATRICRPCGLDARPKNAAAVGVPNDGSAASVGEATAGDTTSGEATIGEGD